MIPHAAEVLARFGALDRLLQTKGFPATSPWWLDTIRRWYTSGKRQAVLRVGRRGGKSSTLCRLGVVEALYGEHDVPPGDIGVVPIISARREDAEERLRTIRAILEALGLEHKRDFVESGDSIELLKKARKFSVYTASVAGVSGFTSIFVVCDECSKWRDSSTGSNPANLVIKSVRPTLATQRNGKMVLSSSPMGLLDAHADAFALGETPLQTVSHAPTWVANPTLTEQQTRDDEPDEADWEREYAAIPQAEAETSLFQASQLDACTRQSADIEADDRHRYVATIDPATRGNAWTLVVACLSDSAVRRIVLTREWRGSKAKPLKSSDTFRDIAVLIAPYRLQHLHSDQFAIDPLRELAAPHGIYLICDRPWTQTSKADAYEGLHALGKDKRLDLPADPQVKTDLLGIRRRLTRSGVTYELAEVKGRHSDFAPAIAMAVDLCKVPPLPMPETLSGEEIHRRYKTAWLMQRKRERERSERHGRTPVTHAKLRPN